MQKNGLKKTKTVVRTSIASEQEEAKHQIEEVGQKLRAMMPFVNEGAKTKEEEVVGSAKN